MLSPKFPKIRQFGQLLWSGELFKDFKPEFRIHVTQKSRFFSGKTCDLNGLKIEDLNLKDWWPLREET